MIYEYNLLERQYHYFFPSLFSKPIYSRLSWLAPPLQREDGKGEYREAVLCADKITQIL